MYVFRDLMKKTTTKKIEKKSKQNKTKLKILMKVTKISPVWFIPRDLLKYKESQLFHKIMHARIGPGFYKQILATRS